MPLQFLQTSINWVYIRNLRKTPVKVWVSPTLKVNRSSVEIGSNGLDCLRGHIAVCNKYIEQPLLSGKFGSVISILKENGGFIVGVTDSLATITLGKLNYPFRRQTLSINHSIL